MVEVLVLNDFTKADILLRPSGCKMTAGFQCKSKQPMAQDHKELIATVPFGASQTQLVTMA